MAQIWHLALSQIGVEVDQGDLVGNAALRQCIGKRRSDVASAHDGDFSRTPGLVFHGSPSAL